jgi:ketosteroid isomerase-like protein
MEAGILDEAPIVDSCSKSLAPTLTNLLPMLIRNFILTQVAFALLLLAACASEEAAGSASDELIEADRAFAALSVATSPSEAFSAYLTEDALQLPNRSGPVSGRDSIVAAMRAGPSFELDWDPQHAEVSASNDLGWTWGVYVATFADSSGNEITSTGKYLNVWRRVADGSWRVVVDMGNSN